MFIQILHIYMYMDTKHDQLRMCAQGNELLRILNTRTQLLHTTLDTVESNNQTRLDCAGSEYTTESPQYHTDRTTTQDWTA